MRTREILERLIAFDTVSARPNIGPYQRPATASAISFFCIVFLLSCKKEVRFGRTSRNDSAHRKASPCRRSLRCIVAQGDEP